MREMPLDRGEDYANNLPAGELRKGDVFLVGGQGEVPGYATVVEVVLSHTDPTAMFVSVKIPRDHIFDYVDRVPLTELAKEE